VAALRTGLEASGAPTRPASNIDQHDLAKSRRDDGGDGDHCDPDEEEEKWARFENFTTNLLLLRFGSKLFGLISGWWCPVVHVRCCVLTYLRKLVGCVLFL
jgi:hypothetical protein